VVAIFPPLGGSYYHSFIRKLLKNPVHPVDPVRKKYKKRIHSLIFPTATTQYRRSAGQPGFFNRYGGTGIAHDSFLTRNYLIASSFIVYHIFGPLNPCQPEPRTSEL
jgi:hypothetical protein